jgi:FkbM family methyltransferase
MPAPIALKLASVLYKYAYFVYRPLYFWFKRRQDKQERDFMQKIIQPGDTVVDIGANIGFYTVYFSDLAGPAGKVYAFEPDRTNFKHLKKTVRDTENVLLFEQAIGEKAGSITLYVSALLNVDNRTYKTDSYSHFYEVKLVALDSVFAAGEKIAFVKLDIQGAEVPALKGMRQVIARNEKLVIFSEFWPYGLNRAGSSVKEYEALLKELGLSIYLMENGAIQKLAALDNYYNEDSFENYYNFILTKRDLNE